MKGDNPRVYNQDSHCWISAIPQITTPTLHHTTYSTPLVKMSSILVLTLDENGIFHLMGPQEWQTVAFANDNAVQVFIAGMRGGRDTFLQCLEDGRVFPEVNTDEIVNEFFELHIEAADCIMIAGVPERFLAEDFEGGTIADVLVEAGEWLARFALLTGKIFCSPRSYTELRKCRKWKHIYQNSCCQR